MKKLKGIVEQSLRKMSKIGLPSLFHESLGCTLLENEKYL